MWFIMIILVKQMIEKFIVCLLWIMHYKLLDLDAKIKMFIILFLESTSESLQINDFTLGNAFSVMVFESWFLCHAFCVILF